PCMSRIGGKNADPCKGQATLLSFTKSPFEAAVDVDNSHPRAFKAGEFIEKTCLFEPPTGPRGRRSTPDSAMRPRAQNCLEDRLGGIRQGAPTAPSPFERGLG